MELHDLKQKEIPVLYLLFLGVSGSGKVELLGMVV